MPHLHQNVHVRCDLSGEKCSYRYVVVGQLLRAHKQEAKQHEVFQEETNAKGESHRLADEKLEL